MKFKTNVTFSAFGKTRLQEENRGRGEGGAAARGGGDDRDALWGLQGGRVALAPSSSRAQRGTYPDNPWIRLTPRGSAAIRSQGSRAHKRSRRSFQLERANKSAASALRCRHHKAKTLTFCLLFIQLLRPEFPLAKWPPNVSL